MSRNLSFKVKWCQQFTFKGHDVVFFKSKSVKLSVFKVKLCQHFSLQGQNESNCAKISVIKVEMSHNFSY